MSKDAHAAWAVSWYNTVIFFSPVSVILFKLCQLKGVFPWETVVTSLSQVFLEDSTVIQSGCFCRNPSYLGSCPFLCHRALGLMLTVEFNQAAASGKFASMKNRVPQTPHAI